MHICIFIKCVCRPHSVSFLGKENLSVKQARLCVCTLAFLRLVCISVIVIWILPLIALVVIWTLQYIPLLEMPGVQIWRKTRYIDTQHRYSYRYILICIYVYIHYILDMPSSLYIFHLKSMNPHTCKIQTISPAQIN